MDQAEALVGALAVDVEPEEAANDERAREVGDPSGYGFEVWATASTEPLSFPPEYRRYPGCTPCMASEASQGAISWRGRDSQTAPDSTALRPIP